MEININEIESNVQTYDPQSMLSPRVMSSIVEAVLAALEERDDHRDRAAAETRVNTAIVA